MSSVQIVFFLSTDLPVSTVISFIMWKHCTVVAFHGTGNEGNGNVLSVLWLMVFLKTEKSLPHFPRLDENPATLPCMNERRGLMTAH